MVYVTNVEKETIKGKTNAKKHYLMQVSLDRLGSSKYWKRIKKNWLKNKIINVL